MVTIDDERVATKVCLFSVFVFCAYMTVGRVFGFSFFYNLSVDLDDAAGRSL